MAGTVVENQGVRVGRDGKFMLIVFKKLDFAPAQERAVIRFHDFLLAIALEEFFLIIVFIAQIMVAVGLVFVLFEHAARNVLSWFRFVTLNNLLVEREQLIFRK